VERIKVTVLIVEDFVGAWKVYQELAEEGYSVYQPYQPKDKEHYEVAVERGFGEATLDADCEKLVSEGKVKSFETIEV
jgi:hypothetical protein